MTDKPRKTKKKITLKKPKTGMGQSIARSQSKKKEVPPRKKTVESQKAREIPQPNITKRKVVSKVQHLHRAEPPKPVVKKTQTSDSSPTRARENLIPEKPKEFVEKRDERKVEDRSAKKHVKKTSPLREDVLKSEEREKFFNTQSRGKQKAKRESRSSIPKLIKITEYIQVGELARKLNVKAADIISKLFSMGEMVTVNQSIDQETATLLASEYGTEVEVISLYEETVIQEEPDKEENLDVRPPVVTIMGHVDHGKTKLLDALRQADIASGEAGGITQHIGAYQIQTSKGKITFLDTPGHEAFTAMRARGAQVTDIVVLVVAANDGVMPQTLEAISHARDAKVPIVVAINKIDANDANPEKVRNQLMEQNLIPEDLGGDVPFVEISALKKLNLDKLEDQILTLAEVLELQADHCKKAIGTVVEAKLDQGRGAVATILVSSGVLKAGDPFVVGMEGGKIRALMNDKGQRISEALPSTPVEILGLSGVPNAGDPFHVMDSERESKGIIEKRQELHRQQQAQNSKKVRLDTLNQAIEDGKVLELKIIIKADVRGSIEALENSLNKLNNNEVRVNIIYKSTGEINETDVMLASAGNAIILAFNTRANARVKEIASREGVELKFYSIIYKALEEIEAALTGMLTPDIAEEVIGELEIRNTFKVSNVGTVGGCMVTNGIVKRNGKLRLFRAGAMIHQGKLKSLKRFQDDVSEVKEGYECGVLIEGYNDIKEGDIIEVFEEKEVSRKLSDVEK